MINEIKALDGQKKRIPTMGIPHKKKKKKLSWSQPDKYFTRKYLTNCHRANQPAKQPINQSTYQPISLSVPKQKFLYLQKIINKQ